MVPHPNVVALIVALAGLVSSSPLHTGTRAFSVSQVANPNFKPHGLVEIAKSLTKYGVSLPEGLARIVADASVARLAERGTGSVKANPLAWDRGYLTPVQIGTPPQTLELDIDSGSSDLWVFSDLTPKEQRQGGVLYNSTKSATAKKIDGAAWNITYGDQSSCHGIVFHDTVIFTLDTFTRGLLGLGFNKINTVKPKQERTWFENAAKGLDAPIWTADLHHAKAGTYDFGFINKTKYAGNITYVDVDSSGGLWGIQMSGYSIGNGTFKNITFKGIADTGTSLALLPKDVVKAYYSTVPNATYNEEFGYFFPCAVLPPKFVLGIGAARITIPSEYIRYSVADELSRECFGGLQPDDRIGFSILGDVVLKSAFVVFDATPDKPRLGLATKKR
ncbi:hypothetical protein NUW58_g7866 [Xylaria curta]|uniref:Uncharacterized protein n=1 Tax=Xylaria curta TaxID=42375 RepID=A0ACC1NDA4_9PEZI|nr:hypothetical protein NUW58_g7866 [Xylaria curta]